MKQISRRGFLNLGSRAVMGGLMAGPMTSFLSACNKGSDIKMANWKQLESQISGGLLIPGDASFNSYTIPYSLQYSPTIPKVIARCLNEQDVVSAIKWAKENEVPLVARSGGHSYAAYSATTNLLLDVSGMNSVGMNNGLATVGGGGRNKHVYAALRSPSLSVTHGRCKEVGVAGLVLGGGIGFNMRAQGLTCDGLVETRMVTADGQVLVCSETQNADVFWAVRGAGGGNFGVHTSFTFKPFAVSNVTAFELDFTDKVELIFAKLQDVLLAAPNTVGAKVWVVSEPVGAVNQVSIKLLGQYVGDQAAFQSIIKPVTDIAQPSGGWIKTLFYWDAQELLSEQGDPEYVYEKSHFAFQPISTEGQAAIFRNIRAWPGTSGYAIWKYFLMGGKIDDKKSTDTAYFARGAKMLTSVDLGWLPKDQPKLAENIAWLEKFHAEMEQYTSKYSYVNFIDRNQNNYLDAYYGSNLDKLKTIKKKLDPNNFFTYPQGIPVG